MKISLRRIIKFQFVAWIGTLVNLGTLWLLKGKLQAPLIVAGAGTIELAVDHDKCNGCGLCVDVCPVECVEMVRRI